MAYVIKTDEQTYWKRSGSAASGSSATKVEATRFATQDGAERRADAIRAYYASTRRPHLAERVEVYEV